MKQKQAAQADQQKHDLELQRLQLERDRLQLERDRAANDFVRASNERIDKLLDVVRYLNSVQDGERTTMQGTYENVTIERKGRILNAHEEDLFNAGLQQLKSFVGFRHQDK